MSFAPSHADSSVPAPDQEKVHAAFVRPPAVVESSALDLTLRALRPVLTDREVTEVCINRPGEAYVETREGLAVRAARLRDFRLVPVACAARRELDRQRIDARIAAPLRRAAGRRAHSDRAAAGDDAGNGRDHDPPTGGRGLDVSRSSQLRGDLSHNASRERRAGRDRDRAAAAARREGLPGRSCALRSPAARTFWSQVRQDPAKRRSRRR